MGPGSSESISLDSINIIYLENNSHNVSTRYQQDVFIAESARKHVLKPVWEATGTVEDELAEVEAEIRAYERFDERVSDISVKSTAPSPSAPLAVSSRHQSDSNGIEDVENAFRETVMSVAHYEREYDETLVEHASEELSPTIGSGFADESNQSYTPVYRQLLRSAVQSAVDDRSRLVENFRTELASLERNQQALEDLLATCDGPSIPGWYRSKFESRLEEISRDRQRTVQRRTPRIRVSGTDFCECFYQDNEWTYPVLTAVSRFRSIVL